MPLPAVLLALALAALSALAVACGGDTSGLLTERSAERLTGDVDRVADAVQAGDCEATAARLQELQNEVAGLGSSVSARLRQNLQDGVAQLAAQATEECQGEAVTPTDAEPAPQVEPTEPETTETTEPPAETTPPAETVPPAETTPPAEPTPPAETAPAEPAVPDDGTGDEGGTDGGTQGDAGTGGVDAGEGAT